MSFSNGSVLNNYSNHLAASLEHPRKDQYEESIDRLIKYFTGLMNLTLQIDKALADVALIKKPFIAYLPVNNSLARLLSQGNQESRRNSFEGLATRKSSANSIDKSVSFYSTSSKSSSSPDRTKKAKAKNSMSLKQSKSSQISNSLEPFVKMCDNHQLFQTAVKTGSVWLCFDKLSEEVLQLLYYLLNSSPTQSEYLKFMKTYGGLQFCTLSIKMHISSRKIVSTAFQLIDKIVEHFLEAPSPSQRRSSVTIKNMPGAHSELIMISSAEEHAVVMPNSISQLMTQLLSSGIGYCLPRVLEFATSENDYETIVLTFKLLDLVIENTNATYLSTMCKYNDWTILHCLRELILPPAPFIIQRLSMSLVVKLLGSDSVFSELYFRRGLWHRIHQGLQTHGHILDVDIKWLADTLDKIKLLNSDDLLPSITAVLGLVKLRLIDMDEDELDELKSSETLRSIAHLDGESKTRIEPHHVELWPTLNSYNSYGYCIKKIPPLDERIKLAEEREKSKLPKISRVLRQTAASMLRLESGLSSPRMSPSKRVSNWEVLPSPRSLSISPSKLGVSTRISLASGPSLNSLPDTIEEDSVCSEEFQGSFAKLVMPSMIRPSADHQKLLNTSNHHEPIRMHSTKNSFLSTKRLHNKPSLSLTFPRPSGIAGLTNNLHSTSKI